MFILGVVKRIEMCQKNGWKNLYLRWFESWLRVLGMATCSGASGVNGWISAACKFAFFMCIRMFWWEFCTLLCEGTGGGGGDGVETWILMFSIEFWNRARGPSKPSPGLKLIPLGIGGVWKASGVGAAPAIPYSGRRLMNSERLFYWKIWCLSFQMRCCEYFLHS